LSAHTLPVGLDKQFLRVPRPTKTVPPTTLYAGSTSIPAGLSFSCWTASILFQNFLRLRVVSSPTTPCTGRFQPTHFGLVRPLPWSRGERDTANWYLRQITSPFRSLFEIQQDPTTNNAVDDSSERSDEPAVLSLREREVGIRSGIRRYESPCLLVPAQGRGVLKES